MIKLRIVVLRMERNYGGEKHLILNEPYRTTNILLFQLFVIVVTLVITFGF
jgi:hypothetical protein